MEQYDLIIIGATFHALGIADGFDGRVLIVEENAKPGYEFVDAFHNGNGYACDCKTEGGRRFRDCLAKWGLLDRVFIPSWTPYVSDYVCSRQIPVLLMTGVMKTEPCENGNKVIIYNSLGRSELFAPVVIDTRTSSFREKTMNAIVSGNPVSCFQEGMQITYTDEQLSIVQFRMPLDVDALTAREHIFRLWADRPRECLDQRIAAVADVFWMKADRKCKQVREGYMRMPSTWYDNPIAAFDEGYEIGGALYGSAVGKV